MSESDRFDNWYNSHREVNLVIRRQLAREIWLTARSDLIEHTEAQLADMQEEMKVLQQKVAFIISNGGRP